LRSIAMDRAVNNMFGGLNLAAKPINIKNGGKCYRRQQTWESVPPQAPHAGAHQWTTSRVGQGASKLLLLDGLIFYCSLLGFPSNALQPHVKMNLHKHEKREEMKRRLPGEVEGKRVGCYKHIRRQILTG
jgi:hypothetical protein